MSGYDPDPRDCAWPNAFRKLGDGSPGDLLAASVREALMDLGSGEGCDTPCARNARLILTSGLTAYEAPAATEDCDPR